MSDTEKFEFENELLVPGDVFIFTSEMLVVSNARLGVMKSAWLSRMMIFQGYRDDIIVFTSGDGSEEESGPLSSFIGADCYKLEHHPEVIMKDFRFKFA